MNLSLIFIISFSFIISLGHVSSESNGRIIFEQAGIDSTANFVFINREIVAKVVIEQGNHLENITYSWFVDNLAFRDTSEASISWRFVLPKLYKVMVVAIANQFTSDNPTKTRQVGVFTRKVKAIKKEDYFEFIVKDYDPECPIANLISNHTRASFEPRYHWIYITSLFMTIAGITIVLFAVESAIAAQLAI